MQFGSDLQPLLQPAGLPFSRAVGWGAVALDTEGAVTLVWLILTLTGVAAVRGVKKQTMMNRATGSASMPATRQSEASSQGGGGSSTNGATKLPATMRDARADSG